MTMPWLKLYHEARTDPKLRAISRDQHYVWFNILCFANEQPERGVIKVDDEEVLACAVADGDVGLLRSSLERLTKLQLVDRTEGAITPHGWGERQGRVDTTAADRSKRYRERLKATKGTRNHASRVTERDATRDERVTSRTVTQTSRTDREEEKKEYTTPRISEHTKPVEAKSIPSQGELDSRKIESQPSRTPEDLADVRAACKLLESDMRTEALGWRLGREHNMPGNLPVAGWKWIRAAEKMTGPSVTESQRREFNYFARIAQNTGDDERAAKPRQFASDEPVPYKPSPPKNLFIGQKSRERMARAAELGIAI